MVTRPACRVKRRRLMNELLVRNPCDFACGLAVMCLGTKSRGQHEQLSLWTSDDPLEPAYERVRNRVGEETMRRAGAATKASNVTRQLNLVEGEVKAPKRVPSAAPGKLFGPDVSSSRVAASRRLSLATRCPMGGRLHDRTSRHRRRDDRHGVCRSAVQSREALRHGTNDAIPDVEYVTWCREWVTGVRSARSSRGARCSSTTCRSGTCC